MRSVFIAHAVVCTAYFCLACSIPVGEIAFYGWRPSEIWEEEGGGVVEARAREVQACDVVHVG